MKSWKQAWRIRLRLFLAAALPAVMVVAVLSIVFMGRYQSELTNALTERARASAAQLAGAAEFPLFARDTATLTRLAGAAVVGDGQVIGALVVPRYQGESIAVGALPESLPEFSGVEILQVGSAQLLVVVPVIATQLSVDDPFAASNPKASGRPPEWTGHVALVFSLDPLIQRKKSALVVMVLLTLLALAVAAGLAWVLAASVTEPIDHISHVVSRIGGGDLDARVDESRADVLQELAHGVNRMAGKVAYTQQELSLQVDRVTQELREQKEAAEKAARIDPSTGVATRRAFTETADLEMQRALRYNSPLSLLMVDLDHFKRINDAFDHGVGDKVLVSFARTVSQQLREVDLVGRLGGGEFGILLPNTDVAEAVRVSERIRLAVADNTLEANGQAIHYSASFGLATLSDHEMSLGGFMGRADAALRKAKRLGRNRVELAAPPLL